MRNNFFKTMLVVLLSFLPISFVYADQAEAIKAEKTYTIKVTAKDPNTIVPIIGSLMIMNSKGSRMQDIKNMNTPFEISVVARFVGVMLETLDGQPDFTMEIFEGKQQQLRLSGTGHATFAHTDTSGNAFVTGSGN